MTISFPAVCATAVVGLLLALTPLSPSHALSRPESVRASVDTPVDSAPVGDGTPQICAGQSNDHIHKWYVARNGIRVPLRCGRWDGKKGFGVRKLVAKDRWNTWYRGMITLTLRSPHQVTREGTTWIYQSRTFIDCDPQYHFRIVVQTKKIGGTKRMRGIITAYQKIE